MTLVAWLDDIGKPAWIALMIVSLSVGGRWAGGPGISDREWTNGMLDFAARRSTGGGAWSGCRSGRRNGAAARSGGMRPTRSSGNRAFDEYRTETLRRLEEEQREFKEFLDRLRHAKDKAEFDQFMAEMRRGAEGQPPTVQA